MAARAQRPNKRPGFSMQVPSSRPLAHNCGLLCLTYTSELLLGCSGLSSWATWPSRSVPRLGPVPRLGLIPTKEDEEAPSNLIL